MEPRRWPLSEHFKSVFNRLPYCLNTYPFDVSVTMIGDALRKTLHKETSVAQKYSFCNEDGSINAGTEQYQDLDIIGVLETTDWKPEDIEAMVRLEVGRVYKGDWPELMYVKRIS